MTTFPASPIRVLLADDHAVLRAGLRLLLEGQPDLTVVEEAADGADAARKARATRPDVVVLDLVMPGTDPRTTIAELTRLGARVVVLTMHDDRACIDSSLGAGASGYVVKSAADTELIAAVRAVARGRQFVDAASRGGDERSHQRHALARLSPREDAVLRLVARGHTNREAALRLGVSVKTIETFRARACRKLHLESRHELVSYALRMHLVSPERAGPRRA